MQGNGGYQLGVCKKCPVTKGFWKECVLNKRKEVCEIRLVPELGGQCVYDLTEVTNPLLRQIELPQQPDPYLDLIMLTPVQNPINPPQETPT